MIKKERKKQSLELSLGLWICDGALVSVVLQQETELQMLVYVKELSLRVLLSARIHLHHVVFLLEQRLLFG